MYKKVTIPKTNLEENVEKVLSTVARRDVAISVYTDEFDLSMFRLFFPGSASKLGYLADSIAFTDGKTMYPEILTRHAITIVRNPGDVLDIHRDKSEKIESVSGFHVFYLKDSELQHDEEDGANALAECSYVCTLFPPKTGVDTSKLQITTVGIYSVTSYKSNLETVDLIKKKVGKDITIMDATACVGGDTIGFAMNFNYVVSIEKDSINYSALVNNIGVYKLDNVSSMNKNFVDDGLEIIKDRKPDVVYFDPPWGGKDYHLHKKLDLFLDVKNIKSIVKDIIDRVKLVVLKVPSNFNYDNIDELGKVDIHKLKKFHIVMISKSD